MPNAKKLQELWQAMDDAKAEYIEKLNGLANEWIHEKFGDEGAPSLSEIEEPLGVFEVVMWDSNRSRVDFE